MTDTSLEVAGIEATTKAQGLAAQPAQSRVGDYFALLKPRVMSLVVFTGFAGLVAAPGALHPLLATVAVLCIAIGAGAAGAVNMWYDRDIDAGMQRTRRRPIPAGKVAPEEALAFGVTLTLFSVMLMGLAVNWTAAALLALANGFYVFVYTVWLKRRTPHNIVIGGAAGAFPPMIGWAAVTGTVSLESAVLFLVIFLWTPPHFWSLATAYREDYALAQVPMLPVIVGDAAAARIILAHTIVLVLVSLLPFAFGMGYIYLAGALAGGGLFIAKSIALVRAPGADAAMSNFHASLVQLGVLLTAAIVDGSWSL